MRLTPPLTLVLMLIPALLLPGCNRNRVAPPMKSLGYGYLAIDPIEFWHQNDKEEGKVDLDRGTLTCLGTVTSQTLATTKTSFNATVVPFNAETQNLRLYADNLLYRIVVRKYEIEVKQLEGPPVKQVVPVSLVVGIGSRIEGVLEGVKGDVSVTGVPGFSGKFEGEYKSAEASVHTVGVMSDTLVTLPRFTGEITQENLYLFFQNLATINSEINGVETSITPHIMGFYVSQMDGAVKPYHVAHAIRWEAAKIRKTPDASTVNNVGVIQVPLLMEP